MAAVKEYPTGNVPVGVITSLGRGQVVPWASVGDAPAGEGGTTIGTTMARITRSITRPITRLLARALDAYGDT